MLESMPTKEPLLPLKFVNNIDFYKDLSAIGFLRDIGRHFRLNTMIAKDSVKSRLASDNGISYTEFSYQILQGNDFYRLYKEHNCRVQLGGCDQWGNITAGVDFTRRKMIESEGERAEEVYGQTTPILVNSRGEKIGKSTGGGNLWMDANKTSPY